MGKYTYYYFTNKLSGLMNDVCKSCRGTTKMIGIGMIEKKCKWCAGTGKDIQDKAKKMAIEELEQANAKAKGSSRKAKKAPSKENKAKD